MDQPPAVAFTAFADAWPRAIETEIGAALCAIGRGKDSEYDTCSPTIQSWTKIMRQISVFIKRWIVFMCVSSPLTQR